MQKSEQQPQVLGAIDQDVKKKKVIAADPLVTVKVECARWMLATLFFAGLFILAVFGWVGAVNDRANSMKTLIVKLSPDGGSHIEFYDEDAPLSVWPSTINSLLEKAFTRRYTEDPRTVANDYTFFGHFLSPEAYNQFIAEDEFDAIGKIGLIESKKRQEPLIFPQMSVLHHMDQEVINVSQMTGDELITSQLFFDFEYREKGSGLLNGRDSIKQKIVTVQWRINPMKLRRDFYNSDDEFRAAVFENPIGIEVLSYNLENVAEGAR